MQLRPRVRDREQAVALQGQQVAFYCSGADQRSMVRAELKALSNSGVAYDTAMCFPPRAPNQD